MKMKIKLILCLMFLTLNLNAQVQLSDKVAKKVVIELIQKDSLSNEVIYLNNILNISNNKLLLKDSIISTYQTKEINYQQQINQQQNITNNYIKQNKQLKHKNNWTKVKAVIIAVVVGAVVYIVK